MTDKPWTYHEFHHSPRRKTYSVMEGIRTIAACSREKDARLIISMKETNAELAEIVAGIYHHYENVGDALISHWIGAIEDMSDDAKELLK